MPTTQLRTYTLSSPEAAKIYAQHWKPHLASLAVFNVETKAVFISHANPKQVVAIVQYADGDDPDDTVKQYMASDGFKADMEGFDFSTLEKVETAVLEPLEFSPFQ